MQKCYAQSRGTDIKFGPYIGRTLHHLLVCEYVIKVMAEAKARKFQLLTWCKVFSNLTINSCISEKLSVNQSTWPDSSAFGQTRTIMSLKDRDTQWECYVFEALVRISSNICELLQ